MSAAKAFLLTSALCFSVGAVIMLFTDRTGGINWMCAGAAFYVWHKYVGGSPA